MIPATFGQLLAKVRKLRTHMLFAQFGSSYFTTAWLSNQMFKHNERNILLMGPPGAGKTCVGQIVGQRLRMPVIDIDDDVLEKTWGMSVADKLSEIGGDGFIEEEGKAVCNFTATGSVISMTGSNPLHPDAMQHLKRSGLVLYLDVDTEDIMQRLSRMKVNRIVGQDAGVSMREILQYRTQFYDKWLDARVLCGTGDSLEDVADKVLRTLGRYEDLESDMFISTRSQMSSDAKFFSDVVIEGLAPDRGLYVPKKGFPKLEPTEWLRISSMPYAMRAVAILENCIHSMDVSPVELSTMVHRAYGQNFANQSVVPLKHLTDHQYILELFHGPTASFKDLALQLMPQLFAHCLPQMCNYLILVATSGDTGSAVLNGFQKLKDSDRERTGVLVFFPEKGVSEIQKLQMTGFQEGNAKSISVLTDFDFCQRSIKQIFGDSSLMGHLAVEYATVLNTANSINWAQLLPQVVYNCSAYMDLLRNHTLTFGDPIDVCIPTGNFGNTMSVICASNHNCIISDFIASGEYDLRNRKLLVSNSPAIDILNSSNLERFIQDVSGGDGSLVRDLFLSLERDHFFKVSETLRQKINLEVQAGWCSEDDCLRAIREVHATTGYIMDTHTAVGKVFAPAVLKALQCQNIPQDPVEQLDKLCTIGGQEQMHEALLKCMRDSGDHPHKIFQHRQKCRCASWVLFKGTLHYFLK
uniref:Threonine synthase like 1 n=1 Tax=Sinocyclocheilus anshuiensis TaxID=1608454 RepID=A0A671SBL4_9TELE